MNESNSIEATDRTILSEQTKFRLDKTRKIENYFHEEINQRKSRSKTLSICVAFFYYIDKILIVLSATTGGVSICSFTGVPGAPARIAAASFTLIISLTTRIVKKFLNITRKMHDKILMLAESKVNSNKTLISQALIDMEISHEEFIAILKEKDKYEKIKDSGNEKYEIMRLSSIKSKT